MGKYANTLSKTMGGDVKRATDTLTTSLLQFKINLNDPIEAITPTLTSSGNSFYFEKMKNPNGTEYRRMSTFPTDFDFCGANIRYVCGMSVPPLMIANITEQV